MSEGSMRETEYERKMKAALRTLLEEIEAGKRPSDLILEELVCDHVMRTP
jgi:hypothetical protein